MNFLTEWAELVKENFAGGRMLEFDVHADRAETDYKSLGRRREIAVRLALNQLGVTASEYYLSLDVYGEPDGLWGLGRDKDVKRVNVQYTPLCD
ncbi:hypothetical protein [Xylophilus sp. GOD-11R]|uniref:hypothetical protein n=1 Tax=Xylophilus sp. GOD-11R TaxID=3089814 RepID=UPI00298C62A5|nr:hypothetical protein [Xylophilus sp. GOD-11R]WPB57754.1 hypothetical protein R9X41_03630 [Xylophilus sp. GOD-11R]